MNVKPHSETMVFLALVFFALIIKFTAINYLAVEPVSDAKAYWLMATSFIETGVMNDGQNNVAFYSAGYALLLVPFLLIFGETHYVAQCVNAALGVISIVLLYFCARQLFKNHVWAVLSCIIWLCYPPNLIYTEYLAKENLMIPLMLSQLLLLLTYQGRYWQLIALGSCFALSMLVGGAVLFTLIPIAYVVISHGKQKLKTLVQGGVFCMSFVIVLSPWLHYTNAHLGKAVIATNGGFNLYIGNNDNAKPHFISITETPIGHEWHALRKDMGEIGATDHLKTLAFEHIFSNPMKTVSLSFAKVARFWTPPYHDGKGEQSTAEVLVRKVWLITYSLIVAFALCALFFIKRMRKQHIIVIATIGLYCLIHGAIYVIYRYRLPVMPFVIVLSVFTLQQICAWYVGRKHQFKALKLPSP